MQTEPYVVRWRSVNEEPEDRQNCHIRGEGSMVLMSIPYFKDAKAWIDIFATSEAGHAYDKNNGITAWVPENELDMDSNYPDITPEEDEV